MGWRYPILPLTLLAIIVHLAVSSDVSKVVLGAARKKLVSHKTF